MVFLCIYGGRRGGRRARVRLFCITLIKKKEKRNHLHLRKASFPLSRGGVPLAALKKRVSQGGDGDQKAPFNCEQEESPSFLQKND